MGKVKKKKKTTFISTKKTSNNNEGKNLHLLLPAILLQINNTNHNLKQNKCK